jgi:cell division protein FtsN
VPVPEPAEATRAAGGEAVVAPYWVQVSAGRDRQAAENLVDQLRRSGFPVQLFPERQGGQAWFKVRVGGFETEERARATADELKRSGYGQAFVSVLGG